MKGRPTAAAATSKTATTLAPTNIACAVARDAVCRSPPPTARATIAVTDTEAMANTAGRNARQ